MKLDLPLNSFTKTVHRAKKSGTTAGMSTLPLYMAFLLTGYCDNP